MEACRIVVVGSGNVATHLARGLHAAGARIMQVCSRNAAHASRLAAEVEAEAITDLHSVNPGADVCLISTVDGAVADVAATLPPMKGIVAHTSGSVPMDVLRCASDRVGVMYPLQTFSRDRKLDLSCVPFFNEASDDATLARLDALAGMISRSVHHADSGTRPFLHVAGVLGCNFPNYLLLCASQVLARGGYSLDVLRPLLEETVAKAFEFGPEASQTGPARRGDAATIERHASMLPDAQAEIYRMLSQAITDHYSRNEQD